jgi:hypothetical protein
MNWNELGVWFVTAFLGAGLAKLIDLAASRYTDRRSRTEKQVNILLEHITQLGQLTELFKFFARYSAKNVRDANGQFIPGEAGKYIQERSILEPEPRFEAAIQALQGTDIKSAIAQKIAALRISSSEVRDIALELDPTGDLEKAFSDLYVATVWRSEIILSEKSDGDPNTLFLQMVEALKAADEKRQALRARVKHFLK